MQIRSRLDFPGSFFLVSNYSACFLHSAFNVYGAVMIAKAIPTVRPQLLHNNNLEHLNTDNSVKFKKKIMKLTLLSELT